MLVELHCHSNYSERIKVKVEGINSPAEIMKHAKHLGVGAVAITDHDVFKAHKVVNASAKKYGVLHIPSEEIDTSEGHVLAIGINEWIKSHMDVRETIDQIHSQGAIAIAAHPFDINDDGIKESARFCDAMEIFNCLNLDRIANIKGRKFAQKNEIPGVAGSDAHMLDMMGCGLNQIDADDVDGIINAVKKGKADIATSKYIPISVIREWSLLRLKASYDQIVDYIENNYSWPKKPVSKKLLSLVNHNSGSVENIFKLITYISLATAVSYSAIRSNNILYNR